MTEPRWKKSTRSQGQGSSDCVEVASTVTSIRDSKNPDGPALRVDVTALLAAIKGGQLG